MRVIEVTSCRKCHQYRRHDGRTPYCNHPRALGKDIDYRTKTFPKFCPLKEVKDG